MATLLLYLLCTYLTTSCQEPFLKFKQVYNAAAIRKTIFSVHNAQELRDANGKTILHYAASKDKKDNLIKRIAEIYPALVEKTDNDGHTPLHFAAFHGNYNAVELLLSLKANPNALNRYGKTPGHKAVQLGNFDTDCIQHIKVILGTLHNYHANLNLQDIYGNTLLHDAAIRGNPVLFDTVFQIPGIDANTINAKNYTAEQLFIVSQDSLLIEQYFKQ